MKWYGFSLEPKHINRERIMHIVVNILDTVTVDVKE